MIATGLTAAGLTSLEKRFKLSSKQTGMIIAANDVSALLLIIFISYFGGHRNKARWLGLGALVTSLGCLLFALPHLLVGKYTPLEFDKAGSGDLCFFNSTGIPSDSTTCAEAKGYTAWKYMLVFIGAKLLLGAGTTPLFTLGPAYIDENVSPKAAPMYLGVWFTATFFGPGIGYVAGGSLLNVWVDLIQVRRQGLVRPCYKMSENSRLVFHLPTRNDKVKVDDRKVLLCSFHLNLIYTPKVEPPCAPEKIVPRESTAQ